MRASQGNLEGLVGTHWTAELSAADINGQLTLQRVLQDGPVPTESTTLPLTLGEGTLSIDFGKKGAFTQALTVSLSTKKGEPYDGCTLSLTFSGTYDLALRAPYGDLRLGISEQTLTSFKGTKCDFPRVADMALSAEDFDLRLDAYTRQSIAIDYLPTLFTEPGAPVWPNGNLGQIVQQLPQFLSYLSATENGSVSGYANVQELTFTRD